MRRVVSIALLSGLLLALPASGSGTISIEPAPGESPLIEVIASTEDGVSLVFELADLPIEEVAAAGEEFQLVSIPGGGFTGEVGEPAIPTFSRLVAIPAQAAVTVRAEPLEVEELTGKRLMPMQADGASEFAYNADAYARGSFDTTPDASVGRPMILGDLRVVRLTLRPVHHNPAGQSLRITKRMRVDVEFAGHDPENVQQSRRSTIPPSFDQLYRDIVVNYAGPESGQSIAPGTYLVICANNSTVIDLLQPLLAWRQRQGFSTMLAHTGQTRPGTASIKNYIRNIYNDPAINLEYVVLAGDHSGTYGIPTWFENLSGFNGEGDHPYTQLAGADVLPDVHIGRLSFANFYELETIVNKILYYETEPELSDPGWFTRAALVGDPFESGMSTVMANQWVKTRLLDIGYTEVDTVWSDFTNRMTQVFNRGDTILGYRGWFGMSGWSNGDTYSMQNGRKMPFAVIMTCLTGNFALGTSLSEGFLRSGFSTTNVNGGIGAIGTATGGTHTRYNNCIYYGVWRGLLWEEPVTMGAALSRGKVELYLNYQETEPNVVEIWSHWNNLMGDPAVDIYTGYPEPLEVDHPASITLGANAVVVTVTDAVSPVEGAQLCLSKGSEVHVVGYTDALGEIDLPITPATTGEMHLTVTRHNGYPYLATVPVVNEEVYVGYLGSVLDDDTTGGSSGNGDGILNPGETIELRVELKNFGTSAAGNVVATLTSDDPHVQILDDTEIYGTIPGGSTAWSPDDFDAAVSPGCPHGHLIRLGLEVTSLDGQWHSLIELTPVAADLVAGPIALYDSGNGRLDPGESLEMSVQLSNDGGAAATDVIGTLLSLSPFVTVGDGTGTYGTIAIGGTGENTGDRFRISAASGTYQGYLASFLLASSFSGGLSDTTELALTVGFRSSTDPVGPDQYGYYAFDNTDTGYPEAPSYSWIELDPVLGGDGTEVVLGDFADYQDRSRIVDLPFPFQYYGESYEQATICSNGWIAMGTTYLTLYRNWTIPGAGGPDAMLAVFWDDLHQAPRSGTPPPPPTGVFQKYDAANHWWIVEWSLMGNDLGAIETFEAILHDPVYHPTDTGDGLIVYQYHTVTNNEIPDGYATVGIESPDQSDGVLYTYYNRYPQGAATLAPGRAIKFVPIVGGHPPTGTGADAAPQRLTTGLDPCRPNPFNPWTTISYRLGAPGRAKLRIYDVSGRLIRTLVDDLVNEGEYQLRWNGRSDSAIPVASGDYLLRLEAPGFTQVRRLTLVR